MRQCQLGTNGKITFSQFWNNHYWGFHASTLSHFPNYHIIEDFTFSQLIQVQQCQLGTNGRIPFLTLLNNRINGKYQCIAMVILVAVTDADMYPSVPIYIRCAIYVIDSRSILQTMKYCNCHGDNCNKDWDAAAAPSSGSDVRFLICQVWNNNQIIIRCKIFNLSGLK